MTKTQKECECRVSRGQGSGSVWERSLTLFEMTHGLCSCHSERSEESFSILRVHGGLKMNHYQASLRVDITPPLSDTLPPRNGHWRNAPNASVSGYVVNVVSLF